MKIVRLVIIAFCLMAIGLSTFSAVHPLPAHALTVNNNDLIDDAVFDDYLSMNTSQIDQFLNSFPRSCISSGSGFRAPAPIGYNPTSGFIYGPDSTAGQIIYDAAYAYQINPQVLLTTLQKEEGLVVGNGLYGCSTLALSQAVGYGCPDGGSEYNYSGVDLYTINGNKVTSITGSCVDKSSEVGFSEQIIHAAWLLKFDRERAEGNTNWAIINSAWDNSDDLQRQSCYSGFMTAGDFSICPDSAPTTYDGLITIDGTSVQLANGATAALYDYTPHFSGNDNFVNIFFSWFGTTYASLFESEIVSQSVYPSVIPGQSQTIQVKFENVGQWTWHDSSETWESVPPVILAASSGNSPFSYGWPGANVAAVNFSSVYDSDGVTLASDQHEVAPGQIVEYNVPITAPWTITQGNYPLTLRPVLQGTTVSFGPLAEADYQVNVPPLFQAGIVTQSAYPQLSPGESQPVSIELQNDGQWTWHDSTENWSGMPPVILAATSPSEFSYGWNAPNVPTKTFAAVYDSDGVTLAPDQHSASPGEIVKFTFNVTAPWNVQAGSYSIQFVPVLNGNQINFGPNSTSTLGLNVPMWLASEVTQSVYPSLNAGQGQQVFIRYQNTGVGTWHDGTISNSNPAVILSTAGSLDPTSPIVSSGFSYGWPGATIPTTSYGAVYNSDGSTLAPNQHEASFGQIAEFDFNITAPWTVTAGTYPQYFRPFLYGTQTSFGNNVTSEFNVTVP